jgi:hypothetical protein
MNPDKIARIILITVLVNFCSCFYIHGNDEMLDSKVRKYFIKACTFLKKNDKKQALNNLKEAFVLNPSSEFVFNIHNIISNTIIRWPRDKEAIEKYGQVGRHKSGINMIEAQFSGTKCLMTLMDKKLKNKCTKPEKIFYMIVKAYCCLTTVEWGGTPPKMEMILKAKKIFTEISNDSDKDIALNGYIGLILTIANEYAYQGKAPQGQRIVLKQIIDKYPDTYYAAYCMLEYAGTYNTAEKKEKIKALMNVKKYQNYKLRWVTRGKVKYKYMHTSANITLKRLLD